MKKLLSILALGLALSACSTVKAVYDATTTPVDLTSLRKTALSLDLTYKAALDLAGTYALLTPCSAPSAPPLCADKDIVNELVRLDGIADPLVSAMDKTVNAPGVDPSLARVAVEAATNAVAAFKAVLPTPAAK